MRRRDSLKLTGDVAVNIGFFMRSNSWNPVKTTLIRAMPGANVDRHCWNKTAPTILFASRPGWNALLRVKVDGALKGE